MSKEQLRAHIADLCIRAGDVTAIAEENARRREAATVANMCSETALALQNEHHGLFEELMLLANHMISVADDELTVLSRKEVASCVSRVTAQLRTLDGEV